MKNEKITYQNQSDIRRNKIRAAHFCKYNFNPFSIFIQRIKPKKSKWNGRERRLKDGTLQKHAVYLNPLNIIPMLAYKMLKKIKSRSVQYWSKTMLKKVVR